MNLCVLTSDKDKIKYMVFQLSEQEYRDLQEDRASDLFEAWKAELKLHKMNESNMQNMNEYT